MSIKHDLRVIKTQSLIRDSFIKLMDEKGFRNITVNDIADNAMINRSTFYLHYTDKYDLLEKTIDKAIQNILLLVEPQTHIINGEPDYDMFLQNMKHILEVIEKDAQLYKIILNDREMLGISRKFEYALKNKLASCFPIHLSISMSLWTELMPSIYIAAIRWWLNNEMKYSPDFLAKELVKFSKSGSSYLLKRFE